MSVKEILMEEEGLTEAEAEAQCAANEAHMIYMASQPLHGPRLDHEAARKRATQLGWIPLR